MVAKVSRSAKRKNPGSGRSLRLGLLIVAVLLIAGCSGEDRVQLGFIGDILPDRGARSVIREKGLDSLFQSMASYLDQAGLVCANLEAAAVAQGTPLVKTFRFNSPPEIGRCLAEHNITAVSLANNHAIDFGLEGLRETAANLSASGITPFGYGEGQQEALAARIVTIEGLRVALIGAVCFPLEGYVYLPDQFDVARWDAELAGTAIAAARNAADLVVVSLHWGVEFSPHPTAAQQKQARYCIERGADLVVGHHPHVLQGMEIYRGKPIFYSLGNFIFDQRYEPARDSVFVRAAVAGKSIKTIEIIPLYITDCRPEPARGEVAARIREGMMGMLKESEGVTFEVKGERVVVRFGEAGK